MRYLKHFLFLTAILLLIQWDFIVQARSSDLHGSSISDVNVLEENESELVCPEIENAGDSWLTGQKTAQPGTSNQKRLSSLRINALGPIDVDFMDGNPLYFPGNGNAWAAGTQIYPRITGPTSIHQLSFKELLELSEDRKGVAADGESQIVVVLRSGVEGKFKINVLPEAIGKQFFRPEPGKIRLLRNGRTCYTGKVHVAFAVYTAPPDFGRRFDASDPLNWIYDGMERVTESRLEWLDMEFTLKSGKVREQSEALTIVRPPVVLVHGLFDNAVDAWLTPTSDGQTLPGLLKEAGFAPFLVDYSSSNGRVGGRDSSFEANKYVVWNDGRLYPLFEQRSFLNRNHSRKQEGGIRHAISYYRDKLDIAVTQADVIGHSMGGVLARVYASDWDPAKGDERTSETIRMLREGGKEKGTACEKIVPYNPDYRRPDNFGQGDINRLITISTPHHGSGQPEILKMLTIDEVESEGWTPSGWGSWGLRTIAKYAVLLAEAVRADAPASLDLFLTSCALRRIGETAVPSHVIAGVTRQAGQEDSKYDPEGEYLKTLDYVGALFFYFPWLREELFKIISKDWEPKFPEEIKRDFESLMESEAGYWAQLSEAASEEQKKIQEIDRTENLYTPYVVLEALRSLMFRFDKNDSTVRLDSQLGGLDPEKDRRFITYVDNDNEAKIDPDIVESVLHRFTPRTLSIQRRVIDILSSDPKERFARSLPPAGQKMAALDPPENWVGIDWQLTGNFAKKWSGMPFSHADAFKQIAKEEKVVIMTRPVNPDSTVLIIGNSATKSMNVKGKSSNWGPQKGYIPTDQRYSKLWRLFKEPQRSEKIVEYNELTREVIEGGKPAYKTKEGKNIVTTRQLEHKWPRKNPERAYTVWVDKGQNADKGVGKETKIEMEQNKKDAEKSIYFARGSPDDPCKVDKWFDWHTGGENGFDINSEPSSPPESPPDCKSLKPLEVLADNTSKLNPKPFLTADVDLLATGFFCPEKKNSKDVSDLNACEAKVKKRISKDNQKCLEPEDYEYAKYELWSPPDPMPCFDLQTGLITEAQEGLIERLNKRVKKLANYKGGNVSHHGPETQFFKSPYVDYPITAFDPMGPDGKPEIISIPKGPPGFRDLHLKRFYEKKIRQGFWLYPNTDPRAKWKWVPRASKGKKWRGWKYADHPSLSANGEDVEQVKPPECVAKQIERIRAIRSGKKPDGPMPECKPLEAYAVGGGDGDGGDGGDGRDDRGGGPKLTDWLAKEKNPEEQQAVNTIAKPKALLDPEIYKFSAGGDSISAGDKELRSGNYEGAIENYEKARNELLAWWTNNNERVASDFRRDWEDITARIVVAKGARDYEKTLKRDSDYSNTEIDDKKLRNVLMEHEKGKSIRLDKLKGANPLYETKDRQYLIKELNDKDKAETEVAAAALAKKLNIKVPSANMSKDGKFLVIRNIISSTPLYNLKEHQLFAFRKEYARQRAFRAWIGDYDGHMKNLLKGPDDRLWAIDFDRANLEGTKIRGLASDFGTHDDLIAATVRFQHGNMPSTRNWPRYTEAHQDHMVKMAKKNEAGQYAWQARMDRMIRYQDMADMVHAIQQFADSDKLRRTLEQTAYSNIDEAVKTLKARAKRLKEVLQPLFDQELIENKSILLDLSWLLKEPHPEMRLAA